MYQCVCMYVCMYAYVCMYVCTYVCMYVSVCVYVCMYVYVYVCVCMYVYAYVYVYVGSQVGRLVCKHPGLFHTWKKALVASKWSQRAGNRSTMNFATSLDEYPSRLEKPTSLSVFTLNKEDT